MTFNTSQDITNVLLEHIRANKAEVDALVKNVTAFMAEVRQQQQHQTDLITTLTEKSRQHTADMKAFIETYAPGAMPDADTEIVN